MYILPMTKFLNECKFKGSREMLHFGAIVSRLAAIEDLAGK